MNLKYLTKGKLFWTLKLTVIILSIGIIFAGISLILGAGLSLQQFVLRIYVFLFAIKILVCELRCGPFLDLFPYMDGYFGKGLFLNFVGVLMISISDTLDLSRLIGIILLICGFGFVILKLMGYENGKKEERKKLKKRKKSEK